MNLELFATIVAAILVARILEPVVDRITSAIFGHPGTATRTAGQLSSKGAGGSVKSSR